jgi:hypothetical protein
LMRWGVGFSEFVAHLLHHNSAWLYSHWQCPGKGIHTVYTPYTLHHFTVIK